MDTRIATTLAEGPAELAADGIVRDVRKQLGDASPVLLVVFASTKQPLGEVVRRLVAAFPSTTVLGASTAGEFTEQRDAKGAISALAVAGDYRAYAGIGVGLKDDPERAVERALEGLPRDVHGYAHRTALLLLDPLAGSGEETTLIAASQLGQTVRLAGGAAGDDLHMRSTEVACGARAAGDAVVVGLLFSKEPLGVGVCHGHAPISPPLRVTKAHGNVIAQIEGRPAWDVWLEQTKERAAAAGLEVDPIPKEKEGAYLLRYEAGLAAGSAYKIRAPLARNADGSIAFACGVAEGSVIRITESIPERQIESARIAARRARAQLGNRTPAGAIVFDCICRNLILGGDFQRAVRGMSEELGNVPLAGFETYGEIALDADDMSGFHNTTSVVLAFPR
jgi:methyl-accepting chemotaxis protein